MYPTRPVIELDRRRPGRRAATLPGPFGTAPPAAVPVPLRAQHTPPPQPLPEEVIELTRKVNRTTSAPSSLAPSRVASAAITAAGAPVAAAPAASATPWSAFPSAASEPAVNPPVTTIVAAGSAPAAAAAPAADAAPPASVAAVSVEPPPSRAADPARHDATDLIPLRARSAAGATRRRLGLGWWIALSLAAAFFLATIAMSAG